MQTQFKIRTTKPKNNKFFMTIDEAGGWNDAIVGYPTDSTANVLANCVGYANGRLNEIISWIRGKDQFPYQLTCNAENFIERAKRLGLKISDTPTLGGILVWQKGGLGSSDGVGHVAIVEDIYSENEILTSESSYAGRAFFNVNRTNSNGRWGMGSAYRFRGCIVNPAVEDEEVLPVTLEELNKLIDERAEKIAEQKISEYESAQEQKEAAQKKKAVSKWAKDSWDKAKKAGITDGSAPQVEATREQVVTMLDRAGVIK